MQCVEIRWWIITVAICWVGRLSAQEVVWGGPNQPNATFEGGLNDWRLFGVYCNGETDNIPFSGREALWRWEERPRTKGFYFSPNNTAFQSPTASNGAVIFDSDYLDNEGLGPSPGMGSCPGPHKGELMSPIIDLSGHFNLALEFHQFFRRFSGPEGNTAVTPTYVALSQNAGKSWTTFPINEHLGTHESTRNSDVQYLDISDFADDNPFFRFKFIFEGSLYFWIVDDISIFTYPEVDISAERFNYPVKAFRQPVEVLDRNEFTLGFEVKNKGADLWAEMEVEIIGRTGGVYHRQKDTVFVPFGQTRGVVFKDTWSPKGLDAWDDPYRIRYTCRDALGRPDDKPADNIKFYTFRVSEDGGYLSGGAQPTAGYALSASEDFWGYGASFYSPNRRKEGGVFALQEVGLRFYKSNQHNLQGRRVEAYIIKKGKNFNAKNPFLNSNDPDDLVLVGRGSLILSNEMEGKTVFIPLQSLPSEDENLPVLLEENQEYMVLVLLPKEIGMGIIRNYPTAEILVDSSGRVLSQEASIQHARVYRDGRITNNFSGFAPYYELTFFLRSDLKEAQPPTFFKVFPNPAKDWVQLEWSSPLTAEAELSLYNASGLVVLSLPLRKGEVRHVQNLSGLPPGTYYWVISMGSSIQRHKMVLH
jgi:adenosyl cobinamide kinase/adenosyl cobinamide phosphate guanylyltransferase